MKSLPFLFLFLFFAYQIKDLSPAIRLVDQLDVTLQETKNLLQTRRDFNDQSSLQIVENVSFDITCEKIVELRELWIREPMIHRLHMAWDTFHLKMTDEKLLFISPKDSCHSQGKLDWSVLTGRPHEAFAISTDQKKWIHTLFLSPDLSGEEQVKRIEKLRSDYQKIRGEPDSDWLGIGMIEYFTWIGMNQSVVQNALVVLVGVSVLWLIHGTFISGFLFWLTVMGSLVFVYGGMAFLGQKQDVLSLCLFILVTVASLEDFLFLCDHPSFLKGDYKTAVSELRWPCFLTSLTTLIGFGSLCLSELSSIRWFGFWASLGVLMEWVMVFEILPVLFKTFPQLQFRPQLKWKTSLRIPFLSLKIPNFFGFIALLVFIIPWLGPEFHLTQSPERTFPAGHEFRQDVESNARANGWKGIVELVMDRDAPMDSALALLEKSPLVQMTSSFSEQMKSIMQDIPSPEIKRTLIQMAEKRPEMGAFFSTDGLRERVFVFLKDLDVNRVADLKKTVESECQGRCQLTGELVAFSVQSQKVLKTLFDSFFVSLLLVAVVLIAIGWSRGHRKNLLWVIVSAFWGPFALLTLINLGQIEVNFVTCIILSVLVGLTGDNAIQYLFAAPDLQQGSDLKGRASMQIAAMMMLISLMLLTSYFDPPRLLGVLLALGFLLSFFGDFYLLRLWINWSIRSEKTK